MHAENDKVWSKLEKVSLTVLNKAHPIVSVVTNLLEEPEHGFNKASPFSNLTEAANCPLVSLIDKVRQSGPNHARGRV